MPDINALALGRHPPPGSHAYTSGKAPTTCDIRNLYLYFLIYFTGYKLQGLQKLTIVIMVTTVTAVTMVVVPIAMPLHT